MKQSATIFWGLALLSASVLMGIYLTQLWQLEQYHYFPALFLALGMLIGSRWDRKCEMPTSWISLGLLTLSATSLLCGVYFWSPWLGACSLVSILAAFSSNHFERSGRTLLYTILPALLLIRLPLNIDGQLTAWLQLRTAKITSMLLDNTGIPNRLTGSLFHLSSGELYVEAACSGVQSVFSLLFCAFLLVAWLRRSIWLTPLYSIAAVFWAGVMNICRVYLVVVAQESWSMDLSYGWKHSLLGYLCLAIAILLLLSTDRLYLILFYPVREDAVSKKTANPLAIWWNKIFGSLSESQVADQSNRFQEDLLPSYRKTLKVVSIALVALMICSIIPQLYGAYRAMNTIVADQGTQFWQPTPDVIQAAAPELKLNKYENFSDYENPALGEHAHVWTCTLDDLPIQVVVSQYPEYHDLCDCYKNNGWVLQRRREMTSEETGWRYVAALLTNSESSTGILLYSAMGAGGEILENMEKGISSALTRRLTDAGKSLETINIQFWIVSEVPISDEKILQLEQLHLKVRSALRNEYRRENGRAK